MGGDLNIDFGSQLEISNRADPGFSGGMIAGDALVSVGAGSISGASSDAIWEITNGDGGHIQGNATVSVNVTGSAGFALGGLFDIENNSFNTLSGGQIDGNAVIDFSVANVSSGDGSLNWNILNQSNGDGAGGQISAAATVTINAANLASASTDRGDIDALINNAGAAIDRQQRCHQPDRHRRGRLDFCRQCQFFYSKQRLWSRWRRRVDHRSNGQSWCGQQSDFSDKQQFRSD